MNNVSTTENFVGLTSNAVVEIKNLLAQPDNAGKQFRVYVEQGGCFSALATFTSSTLTDNIPSRRMSR